MIVYNVCSGQRFKENENHVSQSTPLKSASCVSEARRRIIPCINLSVARFQYFGNFHGCGLPLPQVLEHELFIVMRTSG